MIPGRAIGSRSKNETASRPKNEKRAIANDAAVPSTRATAVASSPTLTESQSEERTSGSCQAWWNQWNVRFWIGHVCSTEPLNA